MNVIPILINKIISNLISTAKIVSKIDLWNKIGYQYRNFKDTTQILHILMERQSFKLSFFFT